MLVLFFEMWNLSFSKKKKKKEMKCEICLSALSQLWNASIGGTAWNCSTGWNNSITSSHKPKWSVSWNKLLVITIIFCKSRNSAAPSWQLFIWIQLHLILTIIALILLKAWVSYADSLWIVIIQNWFQCKFHILSVYQRLNCLLLQPGAIELCSSRPKFANGTRWMDVM